MDKTCVLLLLDGLGDRACKKLGQRTPLQAARTPALDRLARLGACGLYHATLMGQALPSENAHFALFGYDEPDFPGRGALEALGAGVALGPHDVAVLAHLACLEERDATLVHLDGNPPLSVGERQALQASVASFAAHGVDLNLHQTSSRFVILTLTGDVAPFFTDSDPMRAGAYLMDVTPTEGHTGDEPSRRAAAALRAYLRWAHAELKAHPLNQRRALGGKPAVNGLVTQRAGRLRPVVPFIRRWGLRGLSISEGPLYRGMSAFLGLDHRDLPSGGDAADDIAQRLQIAREALDNYDFIHVHTKAPDEAAHTKDPRAKVRVIEALDRGIARAIPTLLDDPRVLLVVTADHSTPSEGPLIHSGEGVPLLMCGSGIRRDRVRRFDEVSVAPGALGTLRGRELLLLILNHLDRAKLVGIMDTPSDQPYWPGEYAPFTLHEEA